MIWNFGFLISVLTFTAPLVLAALAGVFSERSGVINIALEGKMLTACCAASLAAQATGSALVGLMAGIAGATVLSLAHYWFSQSFRIDQIVSGMGINAIALGGTSLANKLLADSSKYGSIPFFPSPAYWVFTLFAVAATWAYFKHTRGGLRLLAVGNSPEKSRQMGVSPPRVRLGALCATGILTGIAGTLIVGNAGSFNDNMTSGRGYIALAAVILGGWRPVPAFLACLLFGFFDALQLQLQGTKLLGSAIPSEAWSSLPYLVTVVAIAGFLGSSRPPAGLGEA